MSSSLLSLLLNIMSRIVHSPHWSTLHYAIHNFSRKSLQKCWAFLRIANKIFANLLAVQRRSCDNESIQQQTSIEYAGCGVEQIAWWCLVQFSPTLIHVTNRQEECIYIYISCELLLMLLNWIKVKFIYLTISTDYVR